MPEVSKNDLLQGQVMLCTVQPARCCCWLAVLAAGMATVKEDVRRVLLQHALDHPEEQSQVGEALHVLDARTWEPDEQQSLAGSLQMPRVLLAYMNSGEVGCMPAQAQCQHSVTTHVFGT